MCWRSTAVATAVLVAGFACSAAHKPIAPLQGVKAPGGGAIPVAYTRPAPDNVVTYSFWRGFGPKGGDRITVWRHGQLIRQLTQYIRSKRDADPSAEMSYANLGTGASADGFLRGPGEPSGFVLRRETEETRKRYRYELSRTSEVRTIASEHCAVWRADPIGTRGHVFTGVARRACITGDGIVLYEAWLYFDGTVAQERIATEVERRRVGLAEVLPPKAVMNWAAWRARAEASPSEPTGRPGNYELELIEAGSPRSIRYRASSGWEQQEEWSAGKRQHFYLTHSSGTLQLSESSEMLSINFNPQRRFGQSDWGIKQLDKTGEALGEECRWFNTAVNVSDYGRLECRSKDNLPLIVQEYSWGHPRPPLTAVSLLRGNTPLSALMPSARTMRWSEWGWPELAR